MEKNPAAYAHIDAEKRAAAERKEQKVIQRHEDRRPNINKTFKKKFRTKEEISEHFSLDCEAF